MKLGWFLACFVVSLAWEGCAENCQSDQDCPSSVGCPLPVTNNTYCNLDTGKCECVSDSGGIAGTGGSGMGGAGGSGAGGTGGVPDCDVLIRSFEDGDFQPGAWTEAVVVERSAGVYGDPSVSDPPGGGNLGAYRRVMLSLTATPQEGASVWLANTLVPAVYTPQTDGQICGIRMLLDGTDQFTTGVAIFSVFLFQNDTYYWGERRIVDGGMWTTGEWPIDDPATPGTSFGFGKFAGPGPNLPDLTANGSLIEFGFLMGASRPVGAGPGTVTYGADNFVVELYGPQ